MAFVTLELLLDAAALVLLLFILTRRRTMSKGRRLAGATTIFGLFFCGHYIRLQHGLDDLLFTGGFVALLTALARANFTARAPHFDPLSMPPRVGG